MLINLMHYYKFSLSPLITGNKIIERVSTYKILGVHIDPCGIYLQEKSKRLYSLPVLKRAGVYVMSILKIYLTTIGLC